MTCNYRGGKKSLVSIEEGENEETRDVIKPNDFFETSNFDKRAVSFEYTFENDEGEGADEEE